MKIGAASALPTQPQPALEPVRAGAPAAPAVRLAPDAYVSAPRAPDAGAPEKPSLLARLWRGAGHGVGAALGVLTGVLSVPLGNLGIFVLHRHMKARSPQPPIPAEIPSLKNQHVVDEKVWRGSAPHAMKTYRALADAGVTTIVDLRGEHDVQAGAAEKTRALAEIGVRYVSLPTRDGQPPSPEAVARFLEETRRSPGKVYVHCGAGVGRTGSMASAYLVETGQTTPGEALRRSLAVGPPSLEQIDYIRGLEAGEANRPNALVVGLSRILDAPRRLWSQYRAWKKD